MLKIFGYGSIIWRPDFPYAERELGFVSGHTRRFWQGSPDHRGTPSAPGRVVTMVPEDGAVCWGMCYTIAPENEAAVLAYLDHRERGGYVRIDVPFHAADRVVANPTTTAGAATTALTYIASPDNEHFLGPAPLPAMVAQIASAHGESGKNADYVINLANHLRDMGLDDPHVFTLAQAVKDAVDGAHPAAAIANAAAAANVSPPVDIPAHAPPAASTHVASSPVAARA